MYIRWLSRPATAHIHHRQRRNSPRKRRARLRAERSRDNHLLHLVGAFADGEDLGVAVEAADGVLLDVAISAVDLHRLLARAHGEAARLELGLRRGEAEVLAGVLEQRSLVGEEAGGLDLRGHV